ncbi:MAG TPA: 50S ribosomal protein L25 [Candidatus Paceibacterota bacterium]|nr:50S ribosomal protein L25 [Candidatus Paceibacterota bacterium]
MVTLAVKKRDSKEKPDALRANGEIPAVFYGPKEAATSITVSRKDFDKVLAEAGESTVITLTGDLGEHDAMIHEVDRDPVSGTSRHVDFYVVEKGKKIRVHVPVEFDGVPPAVKELGGILVKVMHEVEVEAFPKDLPHAVHADVTTILDFHTQVTAGEIKMPAGVELVTKPEEIVAMVAAPKEEVEEAPVDISAIEVEKKGKEAKEGEEAAAEPAN